MAGFVNNIFAENLRADENRKQPVCENDLRENHVKFEVLLLIQSAVLLLSTSRFISRSSI